MKQPYIRACTISLMLAFAGFTGCSKRGRIESTLERAKEHYSKRDLEKAEIEYLNVLRIDARQPEAICGLGLIYHDQGRWMTAAPLLLEGGRLSPTNAEVRLRAAMILLAAGRTAEARSEAQEVLRMQPSNAEAAMLLADALIKMAGETNGRPSFESLKRLGVSSAVLHSAQAASALLASEIDHAEAEARRAVEADPSLDAAHVVLGDVLRAKGMTNEAFAAYATGFEIADQGSPRRLKYVGYLVEQGRLIQAVETLEAMNREFPEHVPTQVFLARIAFDQDDIETCNKWVDKVLSLDPRNVEALSFQAKLKVAEGEAAEGVERLERLVKQFPKSAQLQYELAVAQLAAGEVSACTESLSRVVDLSPEPTKAQLLLAEIHLRRRDPNSALVVLDDLLDRQPGLRAGIVLLAEARRQQGNLDASAAVYRELLETEPQALDVKYRLAQVMLLKGDQDSAREMLQALLDQESGHLPALTLLADLDVRSEDPSAAIELAAREVERNPNAPGPRFLLAQIYLAAGEVEQAVAQLRRVIDLAPNLQPAYLLLARIYSRNDRIAEARSQLESLLEKRPKDVQALLMLGMMDEMEGSYSAARDRYEQVLSSDPNSIIALNNLAYLHTGSFEDLERAFELASQARKIAPRDPSVADTFGWVLLQRGEHARALPFLQEAAAALVTNPTVLFHLGLAYYLNGLEAEAKSALQQALNLSEDFVEREAAQQRLMLLDSDPSSPAGRQALQAAIAENPGDVIALHRLADSYEAAGDIMRAQGLYEAAYRSNPDSLPVVMGLARLYARQEDKRAKALELARRARELAPQDPMVARTLGRLAFQAGEHRWALSLLEESAARGAADSDLIHDLGLACYSVGRIDEALRAMEQVIQGGSSQAAEAGRGFVELVQLHTKSGDPGEAIRTADAVLARDGNNVPALMAKGWAEERLGKSSSAVRLYQQALAVYPLFAPALKRLAVVNAEQVGDDAAAYEFGMRAREVMADDPELARALGKVLYRKKESAYAMRLLRQSKDAFPNDPELLYYLGLAEHAAGNPAEARRNLEQALQLAPKHELASRAKELLTGG